MQTEIEALLALQEDDNQIRTIQRQLDELEPRWRELERRKQGAQAALSRARALVESEDRKQRELESKLTQHKAVQERNVAQLDAVKRIRESTAAMAQIEATRRIIAETESDYNATSRRLTELRASAAAHEEALAEITRAQIAEREKINAERTELDAAMLEARRIRNEKTAGLSQPLLGKYDRIASRRDQALYPLSGEACGNCDTAIPMQRRNRMAVAGSIDVCEACGVLVYRA